MKIVKTRMQDATAAEVWLVWSEDRHLLESWNQISRNLGQAVQTSCRLAWSTCYFARVPLA